MTDLFIRGLSALVMITVAALAIWIGGTVLTIFILAVASWLIWEWQTLILRIADAPLARLAWTAAGLIYIAGAAAALLLLGRIGLIAPVIAIVIATDTGAYFTGRALGGPKIAPAISPSKTWAGLAGGMISAALVALLCWAMFQTMIPEGGVILAVPVVQALATGAGLAILSQAGDFFESWMKRRAGVKDSGIMIPGHGGLLDRVDGLLPVAIACAGIAAMTMGAA
jgi:phosphatidate cytidylyltransferase